MRWFQREIPNSGEVQFPGPLPPRPDNLRGLGAAEVEVVEVSTTPEEHWRLSLRHPIWGEAEAVCPRSFEPVSELLIEFAANLTRSERELAARSGSMVAVSCTSQSGDVMRDRKSLLFFLRSIMGADGLLALDHQSTLPWSRGALDDELMHAAALDVEALYCLHAIHEPGHDVHWLHSHGLGGLGACDVDILRPHPEFAVAEAVRALAFLLLEGAVSPGEPFQLAHPGGDVELVPVQRFQKHGRPADVELRENDEWHDRDRVVVCEPSPAAGFFSWFRPCRHERSSFLSYEPEPMTLWFSTAASELMALRARATMDIFASNLESLERFSVKPIVKLAYQTDSGDDGHCEHLWFEVHGIDDGGIDATLLNEPFDIVGMAEGERQRHAADRLTDWSIMTPVGTITPRFMSPLRTLLERGDEILEMMAEGKE